VKINKKTGVVKYTSNDIYEFSTRWPSHGMRNLEGSWVQFDTVNGELIDLGKNAEDNDGAAFMTFIEDLKEKLDKAK